MKKYHLIKDQYQEMESLRSVHNEDIEALRSKYLGIKNSRKMEFNRQLKSYVENYEKETLEKIQTLGEYLKTTNAPVKRESVGFDKYKKVDQMKQQQKYQRQIKIQLQNLSKERKRELQEYKTKREKDYNREIESLDRELRREEMKIGSVQERGVNDLRFQQKEQKMQLLKSDI